MLALGLVPRSDITLIVTQRRLDLGVVSEHVFGIGVAAAAVTMAGVPLDPPRDAFDVDRGNRIALRPPGTDPAASPSTDWRTNQLYMAHFAVTDEANDDVLASERLQCGGPELAGARTDPFRVWLDDWSMHSTSDSTFPARLRARQQGVEIDVTVRPVKTPGSSGQPGTEPEGAGRWKCVLLLFVHPPCHGGYARDGR